MARSDLIIKLVRAGAAGDTATLRSTAEALAADERAKRHNGFADRITKALETSVNGGALARSTLPPCGRLRDRAVSIGASRIGLSRNFISRPLCVLSVAS